MAISEVKRPFRGRFGSGTIKNLDSSGRSTAGFIWTPNWLLGTRARPRRKERAGRQGGSFLSSPRAATKPLSEFKNIGFWRSYGHFGLLNKQLGALILDAGFRHLLALNGRNFGVNAHSAVNPTPCPGGYFLPTGAKGMPFKTPFQGLSCRLTTLNEKTPTNRSKLTSAATDRGILG